MAAMVGKRISQETFDDVVRENVEDFEMERSEALSEAISQFKSQGVDLGNIDLTGGEGRKEMEDAMELLHVMSKDNEMYDVKTDSSTSKYTPEEIEKGLLAVMALCDPKKCELSDRNRKMMNPGGLNSLHGLLAVGQKQEILRLTMNFLNVLSKESVEVRDFFEPGGSKKVVSILAAQIDLLATGTCDIKALKVLKAAFSLARTAAKSENNKAMLGRAMLCDVVVAFLTAAGAPAIIEASPEDIEDEYKGCVNEACMVMRGMCIHDDLRKEMSCAMDNGKYFLTAPGVVEMLMGHSANFESSPSIAGSALSAAKTLVTTEDAVKKMASAGAMDLPTKILAYAGDGSEMNQADVGLVRYCLGLMRNLCADDIRKNKLVDDGTMGQMLGVMSIEKYAQDPVLMEHGCACLAAMSLRQPANAARIAQAHATVIMVKAMRRHERAGGLQRQCALCIRNIAGRCPELAPMLLDAGVEDVLRMAGRLQEAVDEAYGALRDLNCEVNRVKINADGTVEAAVEQFGEKKTSFKAVWDDSTKDTDTSNIEQRIEEAAQAPFADGHGAQRPAATGTNVTYAASNKKPFEDEQIDHWDEDVEGTGATEKKSGCCDDC